VTTVIGPQLVLSTFLIFCRLGTCLMLMPGFSSPRIPVSVRLFLVLAVTLALAPLLVGNVQQAVTGDAPVAVLGLIAAETMIGAIIGLMGRMFFLALQFAGATIAVVIGLSNTPDTQIEEAEPAAAVTALVTLTAAVLIFIADLHWEVLRALVESYAAVPVAEDPAANFGLVKITDALTDAFLLALRISAPFIVYSLMINLMFGILGKLTPQIPVYFISIPFVLAGGGMILYFTAGEILQLFMAGFADWLARI
jgi:flagellar biosynthetic protein FliR